MAICTVSDVEKKMKSTSTSQRQFHVYRFILPQALLLPIHTLKPCRHHRLMHAGKISKNQHKYQQKKKKKKRERESHRAGMQLWSIML